MRLSLTRSLSGDSRPQTPRSTRNSIDGDGGGQLHDLRCALIAVDFLGSGGSQAAGASFGYWERYDVLAAVRYAKRQFPSAKLVLWGGAPTGAVACALYGSVRLEIALKGMVLDGCTTALKTHVSDLASLAIRPTSALRRKLVDDVVATSGSESGPASALKPSRRRLR